MAANWKKYIKHTSHTESVGEPDPLSDIEKRFEMLASGDYSNVPSRRVRILRMSTDPAYENNTKEYDLNYLKF